MFVGPATLRQHQAAGSVEQEVGRHAVDGAEQLADRVGPLHRVGAGRNHASQDAIAACGVGAVTSLQPIDRDDRDFIAALGVEVLPEFHELGLAGSSPAGEEFHQDGSALETHAVVILSLRLPEWEIFSFSKRERFSSSISARD